MANFFRNLGGRIFNKAGNIVERTTDEVLGQKVGKMFDESTEAFSVGFFGSLGGTHRPAYASAVTTFRDEELIQERGMSTADADIRIQRLSDILQDAEPWEQALFMIRVVKSSNDADQRDILARICTQSNEDERKLEFKRIVGDREPMAMAFGRMVREESPEVLKKIQQAGIDLKDFLLVTAPPHIHQFIQDQDFPAQAEDLAEWVKQHGMDIISTMKDAIIQGSAEAETHTANGLRHAQTLASKGLDGFNNTRNALHQAMQAGTAAVKDYVDTTMEHAGDIVENDMPDAVLQLTKPVTQKIRDTRAWMLRKKGI